MSGIKTRIQFDISEERIIELNKTQTEAGLGTRKELFNSALALFEWAVQESKQGRKIASVDEANNRYKELVMPALETAAKRI